MTDPGTKNDPRTIFGWAMYDWAKPAHPQLVGQLHPFRSGARPGASLWTGGDFGPAVNIA